MMSEVSDRMTFLERVWNTLITIGEKILVGYHFSIVDFYIKVSFIWRPPNLCELTPFISHSELTHLSSEGSIFPSIFCFK